jgi:hypothetical protein
MGCANKGVTINRMDLKGQIELIVSFEDPDAAAEFAKMLNMPLSNLSLKPKANQTGRSTRHIAPGDLA